MPSSLVLGQTGSSSNSSQAGSQQQPPPSQEAPPEAGGPQGEVSPLALPKKTEAPPEPPKRTVKNPEGMADYTLHVNVPLVDVDVIVTTKNGEFIPGLKKENFKIMEDGVPQQITNFSQAEKPVTVVMLLEFAANHYAFINDMLENAYTFAGTLKPRDWVSVISYDMRPEIQQDFTQDKMKVMQALGHLRIPGFSETNLFDALYDTLDRVDRIDGHKYIILISSGVDTFSKLNYDKILKKVKATRNVTIYTVSTGWLLREYLDAHGAIEPGNTMPGTQDLMDYLQADNEMKTYAELTGGKSYFPRFEGQFPEVMSDISYSIRNEYLLSYHSTNPKEDGSYRKIKVELVDASGGPIRLNVNGKPAKYNIISREGYIAKHEVE
ncbi:MAG TPA: VWA domain-containing protein [Terriglobales bacterium]|nr:VWA domain-containing protein [Terriglobales bacterium]